MRILDVFLVAGLLGSCSLFLFGCGGAAPKKASGNVIQKKGGSAASKPVDLDDHGHYDVRKKTSCDGKAYTDDPKKECNGWLGLTATECRDKCTSNAKAPNCPKKDCFAAAHFVSPDSHGGKGWCHLYEKDQCSITKPDSLGKITTFQKNIWIIQKNAVCSGTAYTDGEKTHQKDCNGWAGVTEAQCRDQCSANAKAGKCPQKDCYATVFFPGEKGNGWCHLYTKDQCSATEESFDGQAVTSQIKDFRHHASSICDGKAYTDHPADHKMCNGFGGLTEGQCMEKCRTNARAPNCPKKDCSAAVYYPSGKVGWCHLYSADECTSTSNKDGTETFMKDKVKTGRRLEAVGEQDLGQTVV